ncbi:MAG: DUF3119 family protein [Pseudanabaenaceae cyanobacterium]|jgi:hypothetical protein
MTNSPISSVSDSENTALKPFYLIPLTLVIFGLILFSVSPVTGGLVSAFALFLAYQTSVIRLVFTATNLDVYRGTNRIRQFPYREWQNWRVFWQPVPILFYFKEVKSIHFLPVLFDPTELNMALQKYVPLAELNSAKTNP